MPNEISLVGPQTISTRAAGGTTLTVDQSRERNYPGARWWKFDFHAHTPESDDYGNGPDQASLKQIEPKDWLLGFMRAEVDCVAITDHNSGAWIDRLKSALEELKQEEPVDLRPLYLFPGVEITANGGTHILALFDIDQGTDKVTQLLGAVDFRGDLGSSELAADKAPIEVVNAIRQSGGISILAHVDCPRGAWELSGNTLAPLLDRDELFAMEVANPNSAKPGLYVQRGLSWAEVLGSDAHHPGKTGPKFPGSHYTWVKMAKPSVEGLRLALIDGGGFSIRRSDEQFDPNGLPDNFIEAIELSDARYMGRGQPAKLEFCPWLNALVGGRGTGKSTMIHALRLVARREQELGKLDNLNGPRTTFERFKHAADNPMGQGGLTKNTTIHWIVRRDGVRHRVNWREDGTGVTVEDEIGIDSWVASRAQSVNSERFPVRIFSQGQISELAGDNQEALLNLIDDAAGVEVLQRDLDETRNAYYATKAQIRDLDGKLERRDGLTVKLLDVERKLKRFEDAGHSAVLTIYRHRDRQHRESERQFNVAEAIVKRIQETASGINPEDLPEGIFDEASDHDRQFAETMNALNVATRILSRDLLDAAQRLRGAIQEQRMVLATSAWQRAVDKAKTGYSNLVNSLKEEGVSDLNEYGRLVQERQVLSSEMQQLDSAKKERVISEQLCSAQLKEIVDIRHSVSAARDEFLSATLSQNSFVSIDLRSYRVDLRAVERSLRQMLNGTDRFQSDILSDDEGSRPKGLIADLFADLPPDSDVLIVKIDERLQDLKDRFALACRGNGDFGGHFNRFLEREYDRKPELLDKLLTWFPEDGLSVSYSRSGDGTDFQPIAQASAGQRAAAMLAFLLAHGEEPLVLDQPEDDLDNHLIYDLVVRQIRENKLRRQIIVVTHNPNIVVNGDAEMLHTLDFKGGQCVVQYSGSLQDVSIREEVCRVMEGGHEAFERRYRRLGPELSNV